MRQRGLSLVEKILVLGIILALIAIAVPVYIHIRIRADENQCRANLHALWVWYNTQRSLGHKVTQRDILMYLQRDPEGKKIRCPRSGRKPTVMLDAGTDTETPEYISRYNREILAMCEYHVHPDARDRIDYSGGEPLYRGTGNEKWTDKVFLCVFKSGKVEYACPWQIEYKRTR